MFSGISFLWHQTLSDDRKKLLFVVVGGVVGEGRGESGNTKGGSITVPLTSCLTGLDFPVLQIKTKIISCHTADSKPVKQ